MKRNRLVKWITLVMSLALVLSLVACGGNNNKANTGDDVTLQLWHWKVAFDPGLKAVAEAFEAQTGITVETQATSGDDAYRQKLTAAATAGNLPDAYLYWAAPADGAYDGVAMDMTEELNNDVAWRDSFLPAALQGVTVQQATLDNWAVDKTASGWMKNLEVGQIYGVPIDVGAFYTIYGNKKLLEAAGVSTDTPASIEVWIDNMREVNAKGDAAGFVFSAKVFTLYENWFANFVDYMKNGEESFTRFMNREENMSDPTHIHVAEFIETLANEGLILPGSVSLDIDPADQAFAQERAAYLLGGTFTYATLSEMGMNMDDVISFRIPAYEGSKIPDAKVSPFPLVQAVINSEGEHTAEALEFVKYLTSEEGMILYANNAFDIPAIKIVNQDELNPAIKSMVSSLSSESTWWSENSQISGKVTGPEWERFHANMQKIILGEMTAQETAEQWDIDAAAEKAKDDSNR